MEVESCTHDHYCFLLYLEPYNLVDRREVSNPQGAYTVVVMHGAIVIGHVSRNLQHPITFLVTKGDYSVEVDASLIPFSVRFGGILLCYTCVWPAI